LGLDKSASDTDLKKSFRKLAIKYHPDKVANLGEDHQKAAKDKFQKLTAAYERIKDSRGIK
jgi:DnaJ like chaperone protein